MMLLTVLLLLFLNIHNVQMDEFLTVSSDMLNKYIRGNEIIHKISEGFKEDKVSVDKKFDDQASLLSIETKNDAETNYTFTPSPDILNNTDLGNFIISKAFTDSKLLDEAIDKAVKDLKKMKSYIKKPIMKKVGRKSSLSQCSAMTTYHYRMLGDSRVSKMVEKARIFEETTKVLAKKLGLKSEEVSALADVQLKSSELGSMLSEDEEKITCSCSQKYREFDGTCNRLQSPRDGSSFTCLTRLLPPKYADGISEPRKAKSGKDLPNPRLVSTTIHINRNKEASFTHFLMLWGQFMDHDSALAPFNSAPEEEVILADGGEGVDCCDSENRNDTRCLPIEIPQNDEFFSRFNERCMNFRRSASCPKCKLGPRDQLNSPTSFVDGSMVYGSDLHTVQSLRLFINGLMRFQKDSKRNTLLPRSRNAGNDLCSDPRNRLFCFEAGDRRLNEHPALTAVHTVFIREHNRIARELRRMNPCWNDERLFQEARRIVIAEIQMITYNEFLRLVVGPSYYNNFLLRTLQNGFYTAYNPNINPSMINEFTSACFRFGHSTSQGSFIEIQSSGNRTNFKLRNNFFHPFDLYNGQTELLVRGLADQLAQKSDNFIVEDLTNHLYRRRGEKFGLDLMAINIQRGRDHGIRPYVDYLRAIFNFSVTSFSDLNNLMPEQVLQKFEQIYESVEDIDFFSGSISERPVSDGIVGPTCGFIIALQYNRLRFGDRYFFDVYGEAGSFTPAQLREIREVTLSRILCENSDEVDEPNNGYSNQFLRTIHL
ncbi:heme peroxidase 2-like [Tachypleus tridentatus]|uniref:heme peroxidase 2-like n=1 Tax=Tachypleus tridentatus TaxID=6853 RepID=UPI003FD6415A